MFNVGLYQRSHYQPISSIPDTVLVWYRTYQPNKHQLKLSLFCEGMFETLLRWLKDCCRREKNVNSKKFQEHSGRWFFTSGNGKTKVFPRDSIIKVINKTSLIQLLGQWLCSGKVSKSEAGSPGEAGEVSLSENILLPPQADRTSVSGVRITSKFCCMEDDRRWVHFKQDSKIQGCFPSWHPFFLKRIHSPL